MSDHKIPLDAAMSSDRSRPASAAPKSSRVIPINGDKAINLIRDFVREWRLSGLQPQDIVDEFGERALREGLVSRSELDGWDEESKDRARGERLAERHAKAFKDIPPWR